LIGARLRQARLAAGLSLEDLTSKLERPISKQALSKYESNKSQPSTSTLVDLSKALGIRVSRLLSEPEVTVTWAGFRKCAALLKTREASMTALATYKLENELHLRHLFHIAEQHDIPPAIPVRTFEDAENAAEQVRDAWSLGGDPLPGVVETLEDHGAVVLAWAEGPGFDGLSGWGNQSAAVVVINSAVSPDRIRFNAAHELGHLVMNCEGTAEDEEHLAHRFAAAFLVPKAAAYRELGPHRWTLSIPELGLLKQRWGLSMQAWVRRARDLGMIENSHYKSMNIEFRKRGWHRAEPYQCEFIEEPLMLRRLVWRALTEDVLSASDAQELYPGYERSEEARLQSGRYTLRDLVQLNIDERHKLMQEADIEVDLSETAEWDAVSSEELDDA
jgi:Zn-dependent peptidase ImmA (M78 family)/transcriptional regulator with XRE-family HTH domain